MKSFTCFGFVFGIVLLLQISGPAEALFAGCDHTYNLNGNTVAYLLSPYFPNKYPSGSSCRYKFIVPLDFEILLQCAIAIDKGPSSCTTENFYVSRDGDSSLTGAEQFCGSGTVVRTSSFQSMVVAYISQAAANSNIGGTFNCTITTRPQACDCGWSQSTRIVGGQDTAVAEFPSMVALYNPDNQQAFCGGTIITHRHVITATHCRRQYPNANLKILVGYRDLSSSNNPYAAVYDISSYVEAPGYDATNNANDITILTTSTPIVWSRGVGPVCLPLDQLTNTFNYTAINVVGWGTTSFAGPRADILQKAALNVLPNSVCDDVYPSLLTSQICTYYPDRDACQFDSGGPVIEKKTREFLLGVISFGYACGSNPGVNTRITSFLPWIQNNLAAGQSLCSKPYV